MKMLQWSRWRVAIASVVVLGIILGIVLTKGGGRREKPREVWLNVFVHGSFSTVLGFLNFSDVLKDKVSGTEYRTIAKKMRDDDHFFMYQPMLRRGLIKITPTFEGAEFGKKMYAAYPLIKAYELVDDHVALPRVTNFFYTFGWSGLISKNSRRFEAIRLYNELTEELDRYHIKGIHPKVRLITHSHGGNLCLNLASVHAVVNAKKLDDDFAFSKNKDEDEALHAMLATIKTLKSKEAVQDLPDQKKWDYVPRHHQLKIDELVMYGTPIQQETELFCYAPIFGKVFNFYSAQDVIQRADWVSSKQKMSRQRIKQAVDRVNNKKVYQIKIMFEHALASEKYFKGCELRPRESFGTQDGAESVKQQNIFGDFLSGMNIAKKTSKDPSHKALWFFLSKQEVLENQTPLGNLPVMILTPLLLRAIQQAGLNDFDLNIKNDEKNLVVEYVPHDHVVCRGSVMMPMDILDQIRQGTLFWKDFDVLLDEEFEAVYKHYKE